MFAKANLKVVLQADEKVVAESDDPELWRWVLSRLYAPDRTEGVGAISSESLAFRQPALDVGPIGAQIARFAQSIGVTPDEAVGACRPGSEPPFLGLDAHCWEAYRRQTPARGPYAIGPASIAATLLVLWGGAGDLPPFTVSDVVAVLGVIGARDAYPNRTIRNCRWLQLAGAKVLLNPARGSEAKRVARAFCTSDWADYRERDGNVQRKGRRGRRALPVKEGAK
jgi:hypothetical protein